MSRDLEDLCKLATPFILYVGAELPRAAGLPGHAELARALLVEAEDYLSVRQHQELTQLAAGPDYADLYSELERALTAATFGSIVERTLDDEDVDVPPLGHALARLRPKLRGVITPNLDLLLERAFEGQLVVHPQPTADLASRQGWLLKLNGTLHDRKTWVLTREQRSRAAHLDPLRADVVRSLFLAHPIVFVATRLDDPELLAIVERITAVAQGQPPSHWALVPAAMAGPIARRRFAAAGVRLVPFDDAPQALAQLAVPDGSGSAGTVDVVVTPPAGPAPAVESPPAQAELPPTAVSSSQPSPSAAGGRVSVLFLAANPSGTDPLRVDRELRVMREAIERSRHRGTLELEIRTAATIHDLRRALLEKPYTVVHLTGHGEQEGLLLEDDSGQCVEVPKDALARLFSRYAKKGTLRCVLLNACWSTSVGESDAMTVDWTIAMNGPVSDVAAVEFSRGFYDALGAGMSIEEAHEEGMTCVDLAAPGATFDCVMLRSKG